jgi:transposase, IS6 family
LAEVLVLSLQKALAPYIEAAQNAAAPRRYRASSGSVALAELIPSALHTVERYANNPVEADHGRLKARLRPMHGLKRRRSARILAAGHAFVQNLRRGHHELATDVPARHRLRAAFDQLAPAV